MSGSRQRLSISAESLAIPASDGKLDVQISGTAAFADRGVSRIVAHVRGIIPAAFTLLAGSLAHLNQDTASSIAGCTAFEHNL